MAEKEKQSWPFKEALPAYAEQAQPHAAENPDIVTEVVDLDNETSTNVAERNRRVRNFNNVQPPAWIKRNLLAAKITVFIMFVIGPVLCAFGLLLRDDLEDDKYDWTCESNYIALASEPWATAYLNINPEPGTGRYHADCRLLYHWSKLLIAAGSLSIFRPMLQAIPIYQPTQWTIRYSPAGKVANLHSPSKAHALRTFFSAVPAILYLVCAFILGTSRFITGPQTTEEWYRPIYLVCLSLVCVSFILSLHQAMSTGAAAWYLRGDRNNPSGFRAGV